MCEEGGGRIVAGAMLKRPFAAMLRRAKFIELIKRSNGDCYDHL